MRSGGWKVPVLRAAWRQGTTGISADAGAVAPQKPARLSADGYPPMPAQERLTTCRGTGERRRRRAAMLVAHKVRAGERSMGLGRERGVGVGRLL